MKRILVTLLSNIFLLTFAFGQGPNFHFTNEGGMEGEELLVELRVDNFEDIIGFQFSVEFDEEALEFVSAAAINLPDLDSINNFGTSQIGNGLLSVIWFYSSGVSYSDETRIFSLKFKVLSSCSTSTTVGFSNSPTSIEVVSNSPLNPGIVISDFSVGTQTIVCALEVDINKTDVTCFDQEDGNINVTMDGGMAPFTYLWSNGSTTEDLNDLPAGTYTVTITDVFGFSLESDPIIIGQPQNFDITSTVAASSCGQTDGSATLDVSGGSGNYTYDWSHSSTLTGASANNLSPGDYTIIITDDNGCTAETNITITGSMPEMAIFVQNNCGNMNITGVPIVIGGVAPYTFNWSSGETDSIAMMLTQGMNTVTVVDALGCELIEMVDIPMVTPMMIDYVENDVNCFGESNGSIDVDALGGTAPYTYEWSNGATTQDIDGLSGGTYDLYVTDANGCLFIISVEIEEPAALTENLSIIHATPSGDLGSANVEPTGGTTPYMVSWSTGASGLSVSDLAPGTYTVTIEDANGCITTETFMIEVMVGVDNAPEGLSNYKLFPNPASELLTIEATFEKQEEIEIRLYNVTGQTVYTQNIKNNRLSLSIPVDEVPQGAYLLELRTPTGFIVEKLMIIRK